LFFKESSVGLKVSIKLNYEGRFSKTSEIFVVMSRRKSREPEILQAPPRGPVNFPEFALITMDGENTLDACG
jgi:hypothetical protein